MVESIFYFCCFLSLVISRLRKYIEVLGLDFATLEH